MVRTRFAPSPTGFLHIGSLRTALYNYLYAKKHNGTFILRIEDTDQSRFVEGAIENLLQTLITTGLNYDEGPEKEGKFGPYIQSQRTDIYRKYILELLEKKAAYHCFCSAERLEEMRNKQSAAKQAPMYDRKCLQLNEDEVKAKIEAGETYVIRQKIPQGQKLQFNDIIRGVVSFNTSTIDDQVLMKSDNFPTYHLANVIDDHLMEITHVIRGEEWLPSTPKHLLLYEAFNWEKPTFAHIPLLLNKDKSKLSKRQGDVSVESYLNKGFIPEALINFIALLGWHPGEGIEQEIFSLDELIEKFSLEKVHKAGAIFDLDKLSWFNYSWNRQIHRDLLEKMAKQIDPNVSITVNDKKEQIYTFSSDQKEAEFVAERGKNLLEKCKNQLPSEWRANEEFLYKALITVEDKILKTPDDTKQALEFYFSPKNYEKTLLLNEKMKVDEKTAKIAIESGLKSLESFNNFNNPQKLQEHLIALVQELNLKNGQVLWPLRVALSGEQFSPGVFELMWAFGKEETLNRLKNTLKLYFT